MGEEDGEEREDTSSAFKERPVQTGLVQAKPWQDGSKATNHIMSQIKYKVYYNKWSIDNMR